MTFLFGSSLWKHFSHGSKSLERTHFSSPEYVGVLLRIIKKVLVL